RALLSAAARNCEILWKGFRDGAGAGEPAAAKLPTCSSRSFAFLEFGAPEIRTNGGRHGPCRPGTNAAAGLQRAFSRRLKAIFPWRGAARAAPRNPEVQVARRNPAGSDRSPRRGR